VAEQGHHGKHAEEVGHVDPVQQVTALHHAGHEKTKRHADGAEHEQHAGKPDFFRENRGFGSAVLGFPVVDARKEGDRDGKNGDPEQVLDGMFEKGVAGLQGEQQVEHRHGDNAVAEMRGNGMQEKGLLHILPQGRLRHRRSLL